MVRSDTRVVSAASDSTAIAAQLVSKVFVTGSGPIEKRTSGASWISIEYKGSQFLSECTHLLRHPISGGEQCQEDASERCPRLRAEVLVNPAPEQEQEDQRECNDVTKLPG